MITLNQLSMAYGGKLLFYDVNLLLSNNTRYALVGANGTGKSTFLKLLTAEESSTEGSVSTPKDANVGWLQQDQYLYEDTIIADIVVQGNHKLWQAMQEKDKLFASGDWNEAIAYRSAELEEIIAHHDGYNAYAFAEKLLVGLGIKNEYHYQPLKNLSGGYKLRVLLAKTLFQRPDILLLDEPTNHLDIISINWLEKYLKNEFSGLLIFISHDMDFINRLADYILDVDYGEIKQYSGRYDKYMAEKQLIVEQNLQAKINVEKQIAKLQGFVDRFGASASRSRQAQSRVKMIEKLETPDLKHSSRIKPNFQFKVGKPSGKQVISVKNLSKSYADVEIFKNVNFKIARGEKVAIVGANGVGKSTLIKSLLGVIPHDTGDCEWGQGVDISYFSQDHHDLLKHSMTVLEWMLEQVTQCPEQTIRKTLGQVLFARDEALKDILSLSGGEAARLLLAKIMLEMGNVLVLDEPTNHLDIDAIEALADALAAYPGTLILVSHNRHFINKIATRTLYVTKEKGILDFKQSGYVDIEQK